MKLWKKMPSRRPRRGSRATLAAGCGGKHEAKDSRSRAGRRRDGQGRGRRRSRTASSSTAPSRPTRPRRSGAASWRTSWPSPVKVGDLVKAGRRPRRDRPADGEGPGGAGPRGPRAGARRPRPRRAELPAVPGAREDRLGVGARARHGPDAVRAGEGGRPAGRGGRRGRLLRREGVPRRRAVRRAGSRRGWSSRATSRRPGRPLVTVESAAGRRLVVSVPASAAVATGLKAGQNVAVRVDGVAAALTGRRRRDVPRRRPGEPHLHGEDRARRRAGRRRASPGAPPSTPGSGRPSSFRRARSSRSGGLSDGRGPRRRREGALPRRDDRRGARRHASRSSPGLSGGETVLVGP